MKTENKSRNWIVKRFGDSHNDISMLSIYDEEGHALLNMIGQMDDSEKEKADLIARAVDRDHVFEELLAALERIKNGRTACERCEGDGRLWADGKAHYPSHTGKTIPCSDCAGTGEVVLDAAQIAKEAIAKAEAAQ